MHKLNLFKKTGKQLLCFVLICLGSRSSTAGAELNVTETFETAPASQLLVMPLELLRGLPAIRLQINKTKNLLFLVDSGLQDTILSEQTVRNLNINVQKSQSGTFYGIGDNNHVPFGITKPLKIKYGRTTLVRGNLPIADLSGVSGEIGQPLAGVLGYSFLRTNVTTLDYGRHLLVINKRYRPEIDGNLSTKITFNVNPTSLFPICALDFKIANLFFTQKRILIDTGLDRSAFLTDAFVAANNIDKMNGWRKGSAQGLGGRTSTLSGLNAQLNSANFSEAIPLLNIEAHTSNVQHRVATNYDIAVGAPVFLRKKLVFDVRHGAIYLVSD